MQRGGRFLRPAYTRSLQIGVQKLVRVQTLQPSEEVVSVLE